MDFIKTPTPAYGKQNNLQARPRPATLLDWFARLLQTPTPAYQSKPVTPEEARES